MSGENDINTYEEDVNKLMKVRLEKLEELKQEGKDPFEVVSFDRKDYAKDIMDNFEQYEKKDVSIAGRLMLKRIMGKASFAHLQDSTR